MIGIGIETSCDETSIGIVENGKKLIHLNLYSQIELHTKYRGVVPEIASRAHLEKINLLLEEALEKSNISFQDLKYVSITSHPGLLGSLMIGAQLARCLSFALSIPLVPVSHLEAHLTAIQLENKTPKFPYLGLLLSGGNSILFIAHDFGKMEVIGDTIDDALGEAFDKVASILDLPYPGGPFIEKMANEYTGDKKEKSPFPELLKDTPRDKILFSFSGLKTSVLYYTRKVTLDESEKQKICYHFQNTAFHLVEKNLKKAISKYNIREVVAAGGVLANETLRNRLKDFANNKNVNLYYPEKKILCTDNGAMVASLGYYLLEKGLTDSIQFKISPRL